MSFFEELKRRNVFRVGIAYGVSAWVLLQFADLVLDNIDAPTWIMHVLMLVIALGFVVSLIVAWAYELTPEGIKRESEVDRDQSVTHHTAKKLHYVTLGAVLVLIALLLADRFMPANVPGSVPAQVEVSEEAAVESTETDEAVSQSLARGVAVLPFSNLSEDPNNAFFAGGVHEDILTSLSRIADLRVISRTSMLKIAEQGLDVRQIGQQLNVSHVLEGSVRRAGDRVRVTVQLIDASNDNHLWADNFDRKLDDVFAIQSEVAQKIAGQLETELSPELAQRLAEAPTHNTEAYDLYIKARDLGKTWLAAEGFKQMQPLLEQAVALDPEFMEAQLALANVYGRLVWIDADPEDIYGEKAKTITENIVQSWPDRPEADVAEGNYFYTVEKDYQQALFSYQKALPLLPNDTELLIAIASSYKRLGQFELGLPVINKAESLDPEHPITAAEKTFHLAGAGRYEEAIVYAQESAAKFPDDVTIQLNLAAYSLILLGDKDEYKRIMGSAMQTHPVMVMEFPESQRMLMKPDELDEQISQINQLASEADFHLGAWYQIQISELLNLAGREEESQQVARTQLEIMDDRLTQNPSSDVNEDKWFYTMSAYLGCLANDKEAYSRYADIAASITEIGVDRRGMVSLILAVAKAECGDVGALWAERKAGQLSTSYVGFSDLQLVLDPLYLHYFADIPEYQELVKSLTTAEDGDG